MAEPTASSDVDRDPWSYVPPAPLTVEETGVPEPFLRELVLKVLWAHDRPPVTAISQATGLHVRVAEVLVEGLCREALCEIDGGTSQSGIHFRYRLTDRGKAAAHEALERSRYIGVAPVPVAAYNRMIDDQIKRFKRPPLDEIRTAVEHLVLPERLVEVLGQAFFSRRALMIYGPSGNGKTDIVTSIARIVAGTVVIPYSIYGHGQLIRVYDPDVHKPQVGVEKKGGGRSEQDADSQSPNGQGDEADVSDAEALEAVEASAGLWADKSFRHDRRWLPVKRPNVIVGGDMGSEALEMTYDATQGVHNAPLSVVAQGGVLVIDDLGRQRIAPKEILNRWVLMMEQGYDSFSLSTSEVVRLPLDVTLVFSTNLTIQDLMDEAYLRRIAYKIAIPNPTREQLAEITRRFCIQRELEWSEDAIQYLMQRLYASDLVEPHGCYPRDIVTTITDEAEFQGRTPVLTRESIDAALSLYLGEEPVDQEAFAA